jgi:hypothetical protein
MGLLEGRADSISGEFKSQNVANTVWTYETMRRKPGDRVMGLLEGRAEAISGEFTSQDVASTLRTYATMGRQSGERVMGLLEGRAEAISGEFKSQEVAKGEFKPQAIPQIRFAYETKGRKFPTTIFFKHNPKLKKN